MTIRTYITTPGSYAIALESFFAYLMTEKPSPGGNNPDAHYLPIKSGDHFLTLETSNAEKYTRFPFKILINELALYVNNIDASQFIHCDVSDRLQNKSFCITGELGYNRAVIEKVITLNGGEYKKTISKNLDYLITNDIKSNHSKLKKAKELNIKIISESEFLSML